MQPRRDRKPEWVFDFEDTYESQYDPKSDIIYINLQDGYPFEYKCSHESIHRALDLLGEHEASERIDFVRYLIGIRDDTLNEMCEQTDQCEITTGIDCLACDVFWKWFSRKRNEGGG